MAAKALIPLILALGVSSASDANAAPCGERVTMVEYLASEYDEAPVYAGVTDSGTMVEVLASPGGETWTMLMILPTGVACFLGSGEHWRALRPGVET